MKKKYPDNIVFDYEKENYDSNVKNFPTTIGSPNFEPLKIDTTSTYEATNYFNSKFNELKESYEKLITEAKWTKMIYNAEYSFQPICGKLYHLYKILCRFHPQAIAKDQYDVLLDCKEHHHQFPIFLSIWQICSIDNLFSI